MSVRMSVRLAAVAIALISVVASDEPAQLAEVEGVLHLSAGELNGVRGRIWINGTLAVTHDLSTNSPAALTVDGQSVYKTYLKTRSAIALAQFEIARLEDALAQLDGCDQSSCSIGDCRQRTLTDAVCACSVGITGRFCETVVSPP